MKLRVSEWSAICVAGLVVSSATFAQAPTPDVMVLVDGEKLIGHLEKASPKGVVFKSDLAGELTIAWTKINELQSSSKFAVAKKGQVFGNRSDPSAVPQGTLAIADQKVTVTPANGAAEVVPVAETQNVITQDSFLRAFRRPKLSDYWSGAAGLGFALVQSTQKSKTLTTSLNLQRTVPAESWIDPRYRTTLGFDSAYGNTRSNGTAIKTNIIHAGLEQDKYFTRRLFGFGEAQFDHNYSQDLDLQYTIGGGLGFVAYKDENQELDLKGELAYISQHFGAVYAPAVSAVLPAGGSLGAFLNGSNTLITPARTNNLIGAVLSEDYNRAFNHGITLHQELSVIPSFNKPSDYTANFIANLGVPVSKKFNITFGIVDSYLNDPPPAFQKNSFQFVTNLTYKIN